ncbi:N-6 DNA methylase [Oceanicaulis sp.]|uniref:N-6 DNA methylase n=1 Tax=Oceanicaulis sp. TaxID=1924941 RepID=UPI003F6EFD93
MTPEKWADKLITLNRAERPSQTFCDFVDLAFHSLAKGAWMMTGARVNDPKPEHHENAYMAIVGRYEKRGQLDIIRAMPELMAPLVQQLPEGGIDFLGRAAGHIETLNKFMGQFFTPYDVCRMMAAIQLGDPRRLSGKKGFFTLHEPAAGAGAMILAAADHVEAQGLSVTTSMFVEARDLSDLCFKMSFIQLSLRGIAAQVVRGNTLSGDPEQYIMEWVPTPGYALFHARYGSPFGARPEDDQPASPDDSARFTLQLDLFAEPCEVA